MVQGTINGYGERCGNADLCSVLPALKIKMGLNCVDESQLSRLSELSRFVSELANISPDPFQPYVGASAFAHKGGVHTSAVTRYSRTYEHIDPKRVGNRQNIVVSEISGRTAILQKARNLGCKMTKVKKKAGSILKRIKDLEHEGFHFEAADGSFDILVKKAIGEYKPFFELESFRVIVDRRETGQMVSEATIKIHTNGQRIISTAEGNGPVNALDLALRGALAEAYPDLKRIELTDYKVRVLDESKGTGAVVRVWIETSHGEKSWGTVGVDQNIIEASWSALAESIEYGLSRLKSKRKKGAK
jgi:2-isopropylmalate synthase